MNIAWAQAMFDSCKPATWRATIELAMTMKESGHRVTVLRPLQDRLTYPFNLHWFSKAMIEAEGGFGRFDWMLLTEDDTVPPHDMVDKLLEAADPVKRPLMAGLCHTRVPPYRPGVVVDDGSGKLWQWVHAPPSGVHQVRRVGLCGAILHRSLWDRLPQPMFGISVPSGGHFGLGPDACLCDLMVKNGIDPYVCCDVEIGHVAQDLIVDRSSHDKWAS